MGPHERSPFPDFSALPAYWGWWRVTAFESVGGVGFKGWLLGFEVGL